VPTGFTTPAAHRTDEACDAAGGGAKAGGKRGGAEHTGEVAPINAKDHGRLPAGRDRLMGVDANNDPWAQRDQRYAAARQAVSEAVRYRRSLGDYIHWLLGLDRQAQWCGIALQRCWAVSRDSR